MPRARDADLSPVGEHGGPTQRRVRATLAAVGGYWRPLAGLARLLEELGELAETLPTAGSGGNVGPEDDVEPKSDVEPKDDVEPENDVGSELADLWIISTVLADQFLAAVEEPSSTSPRPGAGGGSLESLVSRAGVLARIVNYYDGPKTPRSVDALPSLGDAVAEFHRALARLASASGVDLGPAVAAKLDAVAVRDAGRFAALTQDPSTAPSLASFRKVDASRLGLGRAARLWGAPDWSGRSAGAHAQAMAPGLAAFTRAADRERLDAYIVPGPELDSEDRLSRWLEGLLSALSGHDPLAPTAPTAASMARTCGEREFTFNGTPMALLTFSPVYPDDDPRHSGLGTFVAVRPSSRTRRPQAASTVGRAGC